MLNTLTKTKTSLKSVSFRKESRIRRSWKPQWTNAFRTEIVTYFSDTLRHRLSRTNRPAIDGSQ
jgi:hypothetical protein